MYVRSWKDFDYLLLAVMLALIGYGLVMIHSATYQTQTSGIDPLVYRQAIYAAIGFAIFAMLAMFDYHSLGNLAIFGYILALILLGTVLIIGRETHGAQRWIDLGFFPLQPSEPAKLAVIFALAKLVSSKEDEMRGLRSIVLSLALVAIPTLLTFLQPDLGTSLVFVMIWLGIAVMGRIRFRYLALLLAIVAGASPLIWNMMQEYMRKRFIIFLDPTQDPLGAGYNIIQALIGVGSGGMWGRGFLSGTQSQLHFLRVQYADFIFSVLAEELGFVGALALIALFALLAMRCLRAAIACRDPFGRAVATGVVTMIVFQFVVNVGMNISLLPPTGIPLPFISYGGSSLISALIGLGIVESIALHRKRFEV